MTTPRLRLSVRGMVVVVAACALAFRVLYPTPPPVVHAPPQVAPLKAQLLLSGYYVTRPGVTATSIRAKLGATDGLIVTFRRSDIDTDPDPVRYREGLDQLDLRVFVDGGGGVTILHGVWRNWVLSPS